jgi:WD40 repeat protein
MTGEVDGLVFTQDGSQIACATRKDKTAVIDFVDVQKGTVKQTITTKALTATALAISPDGLTITAGLTIVEVGDVRDEYTLGNWETKTGKQIPSVEFKGKASEIQYSPIAARLFVHAGIYESVEVFDTVSGKPLPINNRRSQNVGWLGFVGDGRSLVLEQGSGIGVFDRKSQKWTQTLNASWLPQFSRTREGKILVCDNERREDFQLPKTAIVWDAATGCEVRRIPKGYSDRLERSLDSFAIAENGTVEAFYLSDYHVNPNRAPVETPNNNFLHVWDLAANKELFHVKPPSGEYGLLTFSPGGKYLASWGGPVVYLWDVRSGKRLPDLREHGNEDDGGMHALGFSPNEATLATIDGAKTLRLWEVASGKIRFHIPADKGQSYRFQFSPNGRYLALPVISKTETDHPVRKGENEVVRLFDLLTGCLVHEFKEQGGRIWGLAFSPDGKLFASGGEAGNVIVWDVNEVLAKKAVDSPTLTARQLDKLWEDLGGADARIAFQAVGTLALSPKDSVPFLKEHIRAVAPADKARCDRLLADMESEDFELREKAARELLKLGDGIRPALRKTLANMPSMEMRRRIELLLSELNTSLPIRERRSVEVLEYAGTEEARGLLEELAKGVPEAPLTEEAKAGLERINDRMSALRKR